MKKAIIYMEVACGHCGGIINRNYKNSTSVKWLKMLQVIGDIQKSMEIFAPIA